MSKFLINLIKSETDRFVLSASCATNSPCLAVCIHTNVRACVNDIYTMMQSKEERGGKAVECQIARERKRERGEREREGCTRHIPASRRLASPRVVSRHSKLRPR
ncbi:hypothetical protein PUN28_004070 [Cardiocondyla obscurior]|uniref:Uncharacterized protein n=1 Tax=Cardiocondyla obscurior TaxID=286306 RepID=A0AAW2GLL5_9HYME